VLRALQVGLKLSDLDFLEYGEALDIMIEAGNDNAEYTTLADDADMKRLFG